MLTLLLTLNSSHLLMVIGYLLFGIAIAAIIVAHHIPDPSAPPRSWEAQAAAFAACAVFWPLALIALTYLALIAHIMGDAGKGDSEP